MTDEAPIQFTVTPYRYQPQRDRRPARELVPGALWLAAAAMAVIGNFLEVYRLRFDDTSADQVTIPDVSLGYNGWGQHSFTSANPGFGDDLGSGARWGALVTAWAVLLLLAALWSGTTRTRPSRFRPADLAAAAIFGLAGTIAALVISFGPQRHQFDISPQAQTTFHWGPYWPIEALAAAIALAGWLLAGSSGADRISSDSAVPQTQTENEAATDRPDTPTAASPEPW